MLTCIYYEVKGQVTLAHYPNDLKYAYAQQLKYIKILPQK